MVSNNDNKMKALMAMAGIILAAKLLQKSKQARAA
jgi:hypothetical protein